VLLLIAWRKDRVLPRSRDLPLLAFLGATGIFANQVLFVIGLRHTTATNASILMVSLPGFTAGVAALLGVERIGRGRLVGIVLSMAGAAVLLEPARLDFSGGTALGNALILGNCLAYSVFLVLQRPMLRRLPWRTVIAWSFLFGTLGVMAVAGPALAGLPQAGLAPATWLGAFYIALIPTAMGYALSTWAVRRSSPALVAAYSTLQPMVAALLAASLLGERFGWVQAAGFGLILLGLWRVSVRA
jgi:drug/metabolite transporter (DMT)-like permease